MSLIVLCVGPGILDTVGLERGDMEHWKGLGFAALNPHMPAEGTVNPYHCSGELPARFAV